MIQITFYDGQKKIFKDYPNGFELSKFISDDMSNCITFEVNGVIKDLNQPVKQDATVKFIMKTDKEALSILRHSTAHVMAQAITHLYPEAKLTIGPVVADGFYYDIDMDPISETDFSKIEKEMDKIINAKIPFQRKIISKKEALKLYKNEPYKLEILSDLNDDENISLYEQGDFFDLCRGPHIPHTGFIKGFKLIKTSGAYWRADQSKAQLQRIYGTAFFHKKELMDYLNLLKEAKKRDHRKIGKALDLFSFHEEALGMPFFHSKGMDIWHSLIDYWRLVHREANYIEIKTPLLMKRNLWERSGHWLNYRENMYTSVIDEMEYAIKPMNCPGGMMLFGIKPHSYKELPIRAAEIGLVHRHEMSGVLSGLFRVRSFHQDDAHIFMTEDQITDEILNVLKLTEKIYSKFGLKFHLELSTRPEKSIGNDEQWEMTTKALHRALDIYGKEYNINEGDGAFYGPKIDSHIKDVLGRTWQCGTIQLDMSLPERFNLIYIDKDNNKKQPFMIHRTIYGSIERFIGILIEHFAGKFPLWMAPVQLIILTLNDDLNEYSKNIKKFFIEENIRTEIDDRSESLNKKIRDAQLQKIPLIVTLGKKEMQCNSISLRTLDGCVKNEIPLNLFIQNVKNHIKNRESDLDINQFYQN